MIASQFPWMFVILSLALYRLTRLVVYDDGPFDVFLTIRILAGAYDRGKNGRPSSLSGRMISCPHCVDFWLSFPPAAVLTAAVVPVGWPVSIVIAVQLVMWLAVAGGQSLLFGLTVRQ